MTKKIFIFFFSSRRRHTRWPRDWSSDVCSSDLTYGQAPSYGQVSPAPSYGAPSPSPGYGQAPASPAPWSPAQGSPGMGRTASTGRAAETPQKGLVARFGWRSEERRVGEEGKAM